MEITIALALSILSTIIAVLNFAFNRKDKSTKDSGTEQYKMGRLDENLKNIMEKLDKIERKIDSYDHEIDDRIEKSLKNHIRIYHKGE